MKTLISYRIVFFLILAYGGIAPILTFTKIAFYFEACLAVGIPVDIYVDFVEALIRGVLAGTTFLILLRHLIKPTFQLDKRRDRNIGLKAFIISMVIYATFVLSSKRAWAGATNLVELFLYSTIVGWATQFYGELFWYEVSTEKQSNLKVDFLLKIVEMEFKKSSNLFHELIWVGVMVFIGLGITPSLYFWVYSTYDLSHPIFWQYWTVSVFSTLYLVVGYVLGVLFPIYAKMEAMSKRLEKLGKIEQ